MHPARDGFPISMLFHVAISSNFASPFFSTLGPQQPGLLVETVVVTALKSRLRRYEEVGSSVGCSTWGLLNGQVEKAKVFGKRWVSPLGLSAEELEVSIKLFTRAAFSM